MEQQVSSIRTWAETRNREGKYKDVLESLFVFFIYLSSRFGREWENLVENSRSEDNPYSGDSTIFEISCYVFANFVLWLFNNRPELRESLCDSIGKQFIDLFSSVSSFGDVTELFHERIRMYGQLLRTEQSKKLASFLLELLKRSRFNTSPQEADFEEFRSSANISGSEEASLAAFLAVYARDKTPLIFEMLQSFVVNVVDRKKPRNSLLSVISGLLLFLAFILGVVAFLTYLAG